MIANLQPVDYTSGFGADDGGAAIAAAFQAAQTRKLQQAQIVRQLALQQKADAATQAAIEHPTPENFNAAFMLNPEHREAIKQAHDSLTQDQQRQTLTDLSALRGYAAAGDANAFKTALQRRITADKAAGHDTASDEQMLTLADQSLPAVQNLIDYQLAAVLGPDKWGEAFKPAADAAKAANDAAKIAEDHRHNVAVENKPEFHTAPVGDKAYLITPGGDGSDAGTPAPGGPAATPAPKGPVYDQIATTAQGAGAQPEEVPYLQRLAQVESGGNPNARNGSSTSYFQFHPDTFRAALGRNGDIKSLADQTEAAINLSRHDRATLKQAGIDPSDANAYLMHQQGAGGGLALLTATPDAGAVATLTPVYRNPATALAAIAGNIGMPYKTPAQRAAANEVARNMTAGVFVGRWQDKWNGVKPGSAPPAPPSRGPRIQVLQEGTPPADDVALTPSAVDLMAGKYLANGSLPTFGGGKIGAANKLAIINRASDMADKLGLSADDLIAGTATVHALSKALTTGTTLVEQLQANESTLTKNIDLMLSLAKKGGGPTGVPVLNRWIQAGRKSLAGDPDVTAFNVAVDSVSAESAALLTRATGSGGAATTDAAMREAHDRFPNAGTYAQLESAARTALADGHNRVASNQAMVEGIRAQLRAGPGGSAPATTPAAVAPSAAPPSAPHAWPNNAALDALAAGKITKEQFESRYGPASQYRRVR